MTKVLKNELSRILHQIVASYKPQKVILFGSAAWGKPTKTSDWDIMIVKDTTDSYWERQKKMATLNFGKTPVDFFVYTPHELENSKDTLFIRQVLNYGKTIYENS